MIYNIIYNTYIIYNYIGEGGSFSIRNICGGHHTIAMVLQTGTLLSNSPALREIVSGFAALTMEKLVEWSVAFRKNRLGHFVLRFCNSQASSALHYQNCCRVQAFQH